VSSADSAESIAESARQIVVATSAVIFIGGDVEQARYRVAFRRPRVVSVMFALG
jgi:hypothetical protein